MNPIREVCYCGHDKATHHEGGAGPCSGAGCNVPSADWSSNLVTNECPRFRDDQKPDTFVRPRKVHAGRYRDNVWTPCGCYECKQAGAA